MAVATGLTVGGNYVNQPLLDLFARTFGVSEAAAGVSVTVAQVAYGIGLLLLVPLGDVLERRRLLTVLTLLAAAGHAVAALSPDLAWLLVGTAIAGLFSVAAQVLVPFVAELAEEGQAGRAVGTVMSGLLVGALLARSVSGLLAEVAGRRAPYAVVAVGLVLLAVVLHRRLPVSRPAGGRTWGEALRSMGRLVRTHPRLRTRALVGGLAFASVSALFASTTFLLAGPGFGLSSAQIGLVGLAGVGGALAAGAAGRLADRGRVQLATALGVGLLALTWVLLGLSAHWLVGFVLGYALADLALQMAHVSNQNVIYALAPDARARINSVYMTTYFAGGALGSAVGTVAWAGGGWPAVSGAGLVLALLAGLVWGVDRRVELRERAAAGSAPAAQVTTSVQGQHDRDDRQDQDAGRTEGHQQV
ncbi:MFS transporter [Kineococcus gynurae]|uniref:MFS transporter n=1 Tax=Kineococcus gynurae TaxID=452979 RepID=A0ABV5LWI7_9ACTN